MCEEVEIVLYMCVISHGSRSGVAVEVSRDYPRAFYCNGAWYVWEKDFHWTEADIGRPILGS